MKFLHLDKTIRKVIIAGHLMINLPICLLIFGLPMLCYFFLDIDNGFWRFVIIVISFGLGFLLAIFYWSRLISYWRVWAFNKVDEDRWLALKRCAIDQYLIWDDGMGSGFEEIRTIGQVEKLDKVFNKIYADEQLELLKLSIESDEKFSYKFRKQYSLLLIVITFLVFGFAIYLLIARQFNYAILPAAIAIFLANDLRKLKHHSSSEEYLTISPLGISVKYPKDESYLWHELQNISLNKLDGLLILYFENNKRKRLVVDLNYFDIADLHLLEKRIYISFDRWVELDKNLNNKN